MLPTFIKADSSGRSRRQQRNATARALGTADNHHSFLKTMFLHKVFQLPVTKNRLQVRFLKNSPYIHFFSSSTFFLARKQGGKKLKQKPMGCLFSSPQCLDLPFYSRLRCSEPNGKCVMKMTLSLSNRPSK